MPTKCAYKECVSGNTKVNKSCGRCRSVSYCSKYCQKKDWKGHKKQCKPINTPAEEFKMADKKTAKNTTKKKDKRKKLLALEKDYEELLAKMTELKKVEGKMKESNKLQDVLDDLATKMAKMKISLPKKLSPDSEVLICGGGIIGCCTAYYLALRGIKSVVIERYEIAGCASGKAGGFLADGGPNWNTGGDAQFFQKSFDLYEELDEKLNGVENYGYRRVNAYSVKSHEALSLGEIDENYVPENPREKMSGYCKGEKVRLPKWIDQKVFRSTVMGTRKTNAQVHPKQFCDVIMKAAIDSGNTRIHKGAVESLILSTSRDDVKGVMVDGSAMLGDVVVVAMGPWTSLVTQHLPGYLKNIKIYGQYGHSLTMRPERGITGDCIFTDLLMKDGQRRHAEIYPRPDGEVYSCEYPSYVQHVHENPEDVETDNALLDRVKYSLGCLSSNLQEADISATQACYMPATLDYKPVVGQFPGIQGAFIGSGHGCWGITNAPGTGYALADLIEIGDTDVPIQNFAPERFAEKLNVCVQIMK